MMSPVWPIWLTVFMLTALFAWLMPGDALGADRRFVVVVGHNDSDDPTLEPLQYADDDALRHAEVFGAGAERVDLLTELDEDSRALWGGRAYPAPTREAVISALEAVRGAMERAREEGDRPILIFVYSGHGSYDQAGRGFVYLKDGRLTTRDLYHHVIAPTRGAPVVLVVDACNAALLVRSRGPSDLLRPAGPTTLRFEDYPHVGVVLASSSLGETHEWGRYLSGIFSHELRSGLLGPADLNGDGQVGFAELAAFVSAANARVSNPAVRVRAYIRPPLTDPNLALTDRQSFDANTTLRLPESFEGRAWVVDGNLVRYADFHKSKGKAMWLALPKDGPFVLVHREREHLVPRGISGEVGVGSLEVRERTVVAARGVSSAYLDRTLFSKAYEHREAREWLEDEWVEGLEVRRLVKRPWYTHTGGWLTTGGGVATLAAGVGLHLSAAATSSQAADARWADEADRLNRRSESLSTWGHVITAAGGAVVVAGALWMALDRPVVQERRTPPIEVSLTPAGVVLRTKL